MAKGGRAFSRTACLLSHVARRFLYGVHIEMVFLEAVVVIY